MTGMSLELTTHHIQLLVIALISRKVAHEAEDPTWTEIYREMEYVLCEMNRMCNEENNSTLSVEVTA